MKRILFTIATLISFGAFAAEPAPAPTGPVVPKAEVKAEVKAPVKAPVKAKKEVKKEVAAPKKEEAKK